MKYFYEKDELWPMISLEPFSEGELAERKTLQFSRGTETVELPGDLGERYLKAADAFVELLREVEEYT